MNSFTRPIWKIVHLAVRAWQLLVDATWHLLPGTRGFLMESGNDLQTIKYHYLYHFGVLPDLGNPTTYAEKCSWLKLHHRSPLAAFCTDKLKVDRYLAHLGLAHLSVPTIGAWSRPEDIPWDQIPPRFIAKTNHGSSFNLVVKDKALLDRKEFNRKASRWLRYDFSRWFAETCYRGIPAKVLIQGLIDDPENLMEYKFMCFQGEPRFVSVISGRRNGAPIRQAYDLDWQPCPHIARGLIRDPELRPRPEYFDELVAHTRTLARDFLHVRVDLMVSRGKIHFSELTFYNMAGFTVLDPPEWNEIMGGWIDLTRSEQYLEVGRKRVAELEGGED